jgi:molybdopterin-guanine dinucleotide biosynthesis protein A
VLAPKDVTLAVLAGGQGTRLGGAAKGLLLHEGKPFLEHVLGLLPLATEGLIVSADPAYDRFGLRRVEDIEPGRGAPGGVVTALLSSTTRHTLIVACDMPFVTVAAARQLLEAAGREEVTCFVRGGELEPMLAVYSVGLGVRWRPRLATNPSLRTLLAEVKPRAIAPQDPRALDSINTVEQLRAVKS